MIVTRLMSLIDVRVVVIVKLVTLVALALVLTLLPAPSQVAPPVAAVQLIVPIDVVALAQVIFTGIIGIGTMITAIYAVWAKRRADAAAADAAAGVKKIDAVSVQIDGLLAARDIAKIAEGEKKGKQAGVDAAEQLAEGRRLGMEEERASVAAASAPSVTTLEPTLSQGKKPVDVVDEKAAGIGERSATALEKTADAAVEAAKK